MINTSTPSRWLLFLYGSLLLSSLFLSGCGDMSAAEERKVKAEVEQYLAEKYRKEFTIEKSYFYVSKIGSKTETISDGYPQDNPKMKIQVNTGSEGTRHDNYLLEYGMSEANMVMQNVLDDIYGKDNAFPDISCGLDDHKVYDQKWGRTPSLDELIKKYSNEMHYALCMAVFKELKPEQFNDEFKNVYKIVEYMKTLKLRENSLSVYYFPSPYKKIFMQTIRDKGVRELDFSQKAYSIYIDERYFNQVNSPEDIKKYLKIKE